MRLVLRSFFVVVAKIPVLPREISSYVNFLNQELGICISVPVWRKLRGVQRGLSENNLCRCVHDYRKGWQGIAWSFRRDWLSVIAGCLACRTDSTDGDTGHAHGLPELTA